MRKIIKDIHSHHIPYIDTAINNIKVSEYNEESEYLFSIGIHPWSINENSIKELDKIRSVAYNKNIIAIGETGIDHLCNIPTDKQIFYFKELAIISEATNKPLIIHNVKGTDEIIKIKKLLNPKMPWIIHGFRGKPILGQQLINHGFYLSFGEKFNIKTIKETATDRMFIETDESNKPIEDIYKNIAKHLNTRKEVLAQIINKNISKVFPIENIK